MITIRNDVQQLTIKDSTVFIGNSRRRPVSTCIRRLNGLILIVFILMAVVVILPTAYHLTKIVSNKLFI